MSKVEARCDEPTAICNVVYALQNVDTKPYSVFQLAQQVSRASKFLFPARYGDSKERRQALLAWESEAMMRLISEIVRD